MKEENESIGKGVVRFPN